MKMALYWFISAIAITTVRISLAHSFHIQSKSFELTSWCDMMFICICCSAVSYLFLFHFFFITLPKLIPNLSWLLVFLLCTQTNKKTYTSLICNHYFTPFPIVRTALWAFSNTFWAIFKKCVPRKVIYTK